MGDKGQYTLENIELLKSLNGEERQGIEKNCSWKWYGAQEQIIDRHSDSSDVFFMVKGKVRVVNY